MCWADLWYRGEMSCLSCGNGLMIEHKVVLCHLPCATHQQPAQHNMSQEEFYGRRGTVVVVVMTKNWEKREKNLGFLVKKPRLQPYPSLLDLRPLPYDLWIKGPIKHTDVHLTLKSEFLHKFRTLLPIRFSWIRIRIQNVEGTYWTKIRTFVAGARILDWICEFSPFLAKQKNRQSRYRV